MITSNSNIPRYYANKPSTLIHSDKLFANRLEFKINGKIISCCVRYSDDEKFRMQQC